MRPVNDIRKYLSEIGKKGAAATNSKLTAAQRKDSARKAAEARWAKLDKQHEETAKVIAEGTKKLKKLTTKIERRKLATKASKAAAAARTKKARAKKKAAK